MAGFDYRAAVRPLRVLASGRGFEPNSTQLRATLLGLTMAELMLLLVFCLLIAGRWQPSALRGMKRFCA